MADQPAAGNPVPQSHQPRRVAFVGGSQLHLSDEIRVVLQQRLRILAALGVTVKLARTAAIYLLSQNTPDAEIHQNHFDVNLATLILMVTAAAVIWTQRNLSLWVLRLLETMVLIAVWTFLASSTYWWMTTGDAAASMSVASKVGEAPRWLWLLHPDWSITLAPTWAARVVSTMWAYEWAMMIMLYGIFVPNTWRRCALIAGINLALPLVVTLAAIHTRPVLLPLLPRTLALVAVIVGFGSAVAVYGSHKISDLGSQVFAAQRVGQYLLQERVGTGGMGEVYRAQHQLLRRPCAVKLIRSDLPDLSRNLVRFEREVQAMASLNHPNNVEIYDYGRTEDGTFYYVMEYLPGLTLEQLGKEYGPLPFGRIVHFLRQCCGALGEAHRIKLIHRDIKPSNILVCQRGGICDVIKLLDFGLVQTVGLAERGAADAPASGGDDRLTAVGHILGTPAYMSPEQIRSDGPLDGRSDIYSLGCVAYFLLTGRPPFVKSGSRAMMKMHETEIPRPPRDYRAEIPLELQEIAMRCLEKDPRRRFANVETLERALAASFCATTWTPEDAATWWKQHEVTWVQSSAASAGGANFPSTITGPVSGLMRVDPLDRTDVAKKSKAR